MPSIRAALVAVATTLLLLPAGTAVAGPVDGWEHDVNVLRRLGELEGVRADAGWSRGARAHSEYMARHGELTHDQRPGAAGWSAAGADAGVTGNIGRGYGSVRGVLLGWLGSPAHAAWLLSPSATRMGLGRARAADGTDWWTLKVFDDGDRPPGADRRLWPAEGAVVPPFRTALDGQGACDGVPAAGGVAVYLRGPHAPRRATLTVDGARVPTCTWSADPTWHVVAATRPTTPGARVRVELDGPGMPGPRSFRVAHDFDEAAAAAWPTPTPRSTEAVCRGARGRGFGDAEGTIFGPEVACMATRAITDGFPDGTFRPGRGLTRGQTYAFVARLLEVAGVDRPASVPDAFRGDDGSLFEDDVDWLVAIGALDGDRPPDTEARMRRGAMAELVHRAAAHAGADTARATTEWFGDDDQDQHRAAIGWVAEEGIVLGVAPGAFAPTAPLTRGQMAVFLARTLALLDA